MTGWASDDLASIMVAPQREFAGWAQGIVKTWDPDTFENTISYRGATLTNVPVASGLEALTYQPGDVLMLSRWQPTGGGATSIRIGAGGRVIIPGTGAAAKAIQFMQTTLAKQLAAQIFAERIHVSDGWGFQAQTDQITWSDGGLGANNPTLTDIEITDAGFALITLTGRMIIDNVHTTVPGALMGAQMSMQITGATTVSPDSFGGGAFLEHRHKIAGTASGDWNSIMAASVIVPQVLNPGLHTFAARYSSAVGDNLILVDDPSIAVIAF